MYRRNFLSMMILGIPVIAAGTVLAKGTAPLAKGKERLFGRIDSFRFIPNVVLCHSDAAARDLFMRDKALYGSSYAEMRHQSRQRNKVVADMIQRLHPRDILTTKTYGTTLSMPYNANTGKWKVRKWAT